MTSRRWFAFAKSTPATTSAVLRALSRATRGRRLLEIGPGDGRFLAAARKAGFECLGVDVSEALAATARERSGAEVLVGQLPQLGLPRGSFDIVNIEQVLEYVENPVAMLTEVAALLAPGGVCRIREYDADSLSARRAGSRYWLFCPTVLTIWSRRSIQMLAQQSGLQVAKTHHGTEASFSDWLHTVRKRTFVELLTCSARAMLRKAHFFGLAVGADTVFYLRARAA